MYSLSLSLFLNCDFFFLWFIIREGLGEGYDGDIDFVNALESFGGGHNDPIGVAFGGTYLSFFFFPQISLSQGDMFFSFILQVL